MNPQNPSDPNQQGQPVQQPQQWPPQSGATPYQPQQAPGQPTQAVSMPPVPPAGQPEAQTPHSAYDFITANQQQPTGKFGLGGSKAARLLMLVIGGAILVVIIGVVIASFSPKSAAEQLYVTLAQDQQEIARVAALGVTASGEETKAFALNTQLTMTSDKKILLDYLSSSGVGVDPKELELKKDSTTDATLTTAKATNTFDSALTDALIADLKAYSSDITAAYKQTSGKTAQQMLSEQQSHAQLLLKQAGVDTTTAQN